MPCRLGIAAVLILLLAAAAAAAASGIVTGSVRQSGQAPLADAEVQLINLSTAQVLRTRSGTDGAFELLSVPSGRYSLALVRDGYQAWRSGPFEVLPGIPVEFPAIVLRQLSAAATLPRSGLEEMALEYGLVREQIESLPVVLGSEGRTAVDKLLHLVPGVVPAESLDVDPDTGRAALVSANGSRSSFINFKLDGASNNAQNRLTGAQAATFGPAPEALESVRVITHTYSARDGRNAGAVVDPRFREGGDQWHGQVRAFGRPPRARPSGAFDGSRDRIGGFAAGAQAGGPLSAGRKVHGFFDGEGWLTSRSHGALRRVLSENERTGDFFGFENQPVDPDTGEPFPSGKIPASRLDPLMQSYLAALVPAPNLEGGWTRWSESLASSGAVFLARVDGRGRHFSHYFSHHTYANHVREPPVEAFTASPGTVNDRRQVSHHSQYALTHTPAPPFTHSLRMAMQQLGSEERSGHPGLDGTAARDFGFDYGNFDPASLPNVRLWNDLGQLQLHVAPLVEAEESQQTTLSVAYDAELRLRRQVVRAGLLGQRGLWPFTHSENPAGTFSFPVPPSPPSRFRGQGLRDLLLGRPGELRVQTPRSLDLRWLEFAAYAEAEIRPRRDLKVTVGLRFEQQPPGVDTEDRLVTFRENSQSVRFPESPPYLLFPGDTDREGLVVPRSTIGTQGRNFSPRVGVAYSPSWNGRGARWVLGESGRSVLRGAYGVFFDHGTFAGSSAAALFQATYPPFSTDNRYTVRDPNGLFQEPGRVLGDRTLATIRTGVLRFPLLVFDDRFENARAEHWNVSWQRLLPARIFVTGSYLGTRSTRLQRQRELNGFVRNPLHSFAFVRYMRRYSRFDNIRSFESSGSARYRAVQIRANRYLRRGVALDAGYSWSRSMDNGSTILGEELTGADWTHSDFDRRHSLTAAWMWEMRLPRRWADRAPWLDGWALSGIWRWRSGLPLDIRQTEDPSYTFEQVGRPDRVAPFKSLDPGQLRTFPLSGGRELSGHFAFDPTAFRTVQPKDFDQVRQGTSRRNEYRSAGFQQWDIRIARAIEAFEGVSMEVGVDLLNAFGNRNWAAPFNNVDDTYFGVAKRSGLGRTAQVAARLRF